MIFKFSANLFEMEHRLTQTNVLETGVYRKQETDQTCVNLALQISLIPSLNDLSLFEDSSVTRRDTQGPATSAG